MRTTRPRRVALIGHAIGYSRSPTMQQAAFDARGIHARYELWDTPPELLTERIAHLRAGEMLGANVTTPYKLAVLPLLDELTPAVRQYAGAVNTIVRAGRGAHIRLIGHNTDLAALLYLLDEHAPARAGQRMLVLGAGGVACAALAAAVLRGMEPWMATRRVEAARAALGALWWRTHAATAQQQSPMPAEWLTRALALTGTDTLAAVLAHTAVVVQATPVGTENAHATVLPLALLRLLPSDALVLDMVYHPPVTALVRAARAAGLRAEGGTRMLLYQGAASFRLWTRQAAPLEAMHAALAGDEA